MTLASRHDVDEFGTTRQLFFWWNENKTVKIITTKFSLWNNSKLFFHFHLVGNVIFRGKKITKFNAIIQCYWGEEVTMQYNFFMACCYCTIMLSAFLLHFCVILMLLLFFFLNVIYAYLAIVALRWSVSKNDGTTTKLIDLCG